MANKVPRSKENDYTREMAEARRRFVQERTGTALEHVGSFSFDPGVLPGNVENFIGVAQVPIGLAGPLRIDGEHAKGDFFVPLATTRGHAGRQLQPRHAPAERERRRQDHGRRAVHAALAGLHPRRRAEGARLRRLGRRSTSTTIKAVAETTTRVGQADQHRPVRDRPAALPALQLHDRRRRRPEHDRQGHVRGLRVDQEDTIPAAPNYILSGNIDTDKKHSRDQHAADARQARRRRVHDQGRPAEEHDGRRARRSCSGRVRSPTPAPSWPARRTTARTRRTA